MNDPQIIRCDAVLLPNEMQAQLAARASQALAPQGSLFALDNQTIYPHVSLYMFQMSLDSQAECIAVLQEIASQTNMQLLKQDGYFYKDSGHWKGYVDVSYRRNHEIEALQKKVIGTFTQLRADAGESDDFLAVGEEYRPHVTLTKFPAEIEPDLTVLPLVTDFSGEFARIGLFEMGQHGTCIRKIAEFDLSA